MVLNIKNVIKSVNEHMIDGMSDKMNSLEVDYNCLATRHQNEIEELVEQRNRMHDERVQLEKQMWVMIWFPNWLFYALSNTRLILWYCNKKRLQLQNNTPKIEELKAQQRDEIAQLSAHNVSLQKKCDKFKDLIGLWTKRTELGKTATRPKATISCLMEWKYHD